MIRGAGGYLEFDRKLYSRARGVIQSRHYMNGGYKDMVACHDDLRDLGETPKHLAALLHPGSLRTLQLAIRKAFELERVPNMEETGLYLKTLRPTFKHMDRVDPILRRRIQQVCEFIGSTDPDNLI